MLCTLPARACAVTPVPCGLFTRLPSNGGGRGFLPVQYLGPMMTDERSGNSDARNSATPTVGQRGSLAAWLCGVGY